MLKIEVAQTSDVPAIQKILRETWCDTYTAHLSQATLDEVFANWQSIEFLTKQVSNPDMYFLVAKDENVVQGIATATYKDEVISIFRLYVHPQYQRKGIGQALLENILKHFIQAKKLRLHVEEFNTKAQIFYKKHGFTEIKRESEKVVNETINEILMEKVL